MSRVGRIPISFSKDTRVAVDKNNLVTVIGKFGTLQKNINNLVKIKVLDGKVSFLINKESKQSKMQSGTARSLIKNMISGVNKPFSKKIKLVGVGYRFSIKDNFINLFIGFSHYIKHKFNKLITAKKISQNEFELLCIDKELLGKEASEIRNYKKPEIYKGKGVRYSLEHVTIKEAKKK